MLFKYLSPRNVKTYYAKKPHLRVFHLSKILMTWK